jgi:threonine dehydrogenase-like Zn-dependent dehydrogenase
MAIATETMQALVFHGPGDVRLERRPVPAPGPDELLLRVGLAGICGSDLNRYRGQAAPLPGPQILGHEFFGTVVELGDGVERIDRGDDVVVNPLIVDGDCTYCTSGHENLCPSRRLIGGQEPGAFAEYVVVPSNACLPLGTGFDAAAAALIEPLACAVRVRELAQVEPGREALVIGAGMIGLLVTAVLSPVGCTVLVADSDPRRAEAAASWGATGEYDRPRSRRFPLVVDAVGTAGTRQLALSALEPGGRAIFVGLHEDEALLPTKQWVVNEWEVRGSFAYTHANFLAASTLAESIFAPRADSLQRVGVEDAPRAFEELAQRALQAPRVLVDPSRA